MILVDIILCGTSGTFWISDFKNELVEMLYLPMF